eukprot:5693330-Prymnesium_polylepis.1
MATVPAALAARYALRRSRSLAFTGAGMPGGIGPSDCARQRLSTWPAANPHTLQLPLASVQSAM